MTLVKKHLPAGEPWLCPVERAAQATGKKTDANLPSNHRDKAQNSNTEKGAIPNSQDRQGRLHTEIKELKHREVAPGSSTKSYPERSSNQARAQTQKICWYECIR
ncbi:uncharacterized protein LOC144294885 isoform X1 [Canis aureus]